jgi:hypothetical protein
MPKINDFLLSDGWAFIGTCGCTPKMDKYVKGDYKTKVGYSANQRFEIYYYSKPISSGNGFDNFKQQYELIFKT